MINSKKNIHILNIHRERERGGSVQDTKKRWEFQLRNSKALLVYFLGLLLLLVNVIDDDDDNISILTIT